MMLIEFSVGNYRSIKEIVTLSMVAAPITEHEDTHVFAVDKFELLKSAVIYGANASGKSNLLKALWFMKWFVSNSSKESQTTKPIAIDLFQLSTETEKAPAFFEITFICDHKKYRYGFEIDRQKVHAEWLFFKPSRQEAKLFTREGEHISISRNFKEGKGLPSKTRPNALFLSVVAQFNGEIATKILQWFEEHCRIISGLDDSFYEGFTLEQLEHHEFKKIALAYLKIADLGINDIGIKKMKLNIPKLPENIKVDFRKSAENEFDGVLTPYVLQNNEGGVEAILTPCMHIKYNENLQPTSIEEFDLDLNESRGTQKFLMLLGPLLDTLNNGYTLIVDELDARLHPLLTRFIVQLFHNTQANSKSAQLIFATHDTNLLTNELFRRDQIWFTEKDQYGATALYSLVEYKQAQKKVRKDASFAKDYILGKYGAIPFIGNVELFSDNPK